MEAEVSNRIAIAFGTMAVAPAGHARVHRHLRVLAPGDLPFEPPDLELRYRSLSVRRPAVQQGWAKRWGDPG